jgi:hypothetical protein
MLLLAKGKKCKILGKGGGFMAQAFAEYLRSRRIRLSDLARDAGLKHSTTLFHWKQGDVLAPYRPNVIKVAEALKITTDELFALIEESYYRAHPEERPSDPQPIPDVA